MLRFCLLVLLSAGLGVVQAAELDVKPIKVGLSRAFPGTQFDSLRVRPSKIPGLVEVELDTSVFYVTPDGGHVLLGDLIDTQTRDNLTEKRRQTLTAKILDGLPEKNMIVIAPKETRGTITVFTDVDCVYCRRLHNDDVPELTKHGVKVRYLLFPRQGVGSETYARAVSVWCAGDRLKAVGEAKAGKEIPVKTCANPVNENLELAERLGVSGTPAIFLADGKKLPGYLTAKQLLTLLGL